MRGRVDTRQPAIVRFGKDRGQCGILGLLTERLIYGKVISTSNQSRSVAAIEGRQTWARVDEI